MNFYLRQMKCVLVFTFSIIFFMSTFTSTLAASSTDVQKHWAKADLNEWINKGYLQGYSDGSISPDRAITRGEFITFINRLFGFIEEISVTFKDVDKNSWDYREIAKAQKADYINGYEDNTFRSGNLITRQEAAKILASLITEKTGSTAGLDTFKDASNFASWSRGAVELLITKAVFIGYEDGTFRPNEPITRAEAIVSINRVKNLVRNEYNEPGTYGPAIGMSTIHGDVTINSPNVTLQNVTITGNLVVGVNVGESEVYLHNVTVKGSTSVLGGGENSVHFKDCVLLTTIVNKHDGMVRVVFEGKTTVQLVQLKSSAKIELIPEQDNLVSKMELVEGIPANSLITLIGNFEAVDIHAQKVNVEIRSGTIKKLIVNKDADEIKLSLSNTVTIEHLLLNALANVLGTGKVTTAIINDGAQGSIFDQKPSQIDGSQKDSIKVTQPVFAGGGGFVGGGGGISLKTESPNFNKIISVNRLFGADDINYTDYSVPGRIVKVYNAPIGGDLIGSENNVTVRITNGFDANWSHVYLTLTDPGKLESDRVAHKIATVLPNQPRNIRIINHDNGDDEIEFLDIPTIGFGFIKLYDASKNSIESTMGSYSFYNVTGGFNSVVNSVYASYTVTEDTYAYIESDYTEIPVPTIGSQVVLIGAAPINLSSQQIPNNSGDSNITVLAGFSSDPNVMRISVVNNGISITPVRIGNATASIVYRLSSGFTVSVLIDVYVTTPVTAK